MPIEYRDDGAKLNELSVNYADVFNKLMACSQTYAYTIFGCDIQTDGQTDGRMDGQTDRHWTLTVRVLPFWYGTLNIIINGMEIFVNFVINVIFTLFG